jgi:hypothetical protein
MAKKKNSLPTGFEDLSGKIIHTESKEEYTWVDNDLVCKSTGEVYEEGVETKKEVPKLKKSFPKLSDYKAKIKHKSVEYKPQEWIDMSPAFKEVTKLPGIPTGHVIMNYGKSDVGKTTMLVEAGAYAQKQGILPILIITENKFSWDRAEEMGLSEDNCIVYNGVETIEEGCEYIIKHLKDQESGELPHDIIFLWDSIGGTPSEAEFEANENGGGRAMMETAKVLRAKITRYIGPKINATRKKEFPYTSTFLIVNHAYTSPPQFPAKVGTIQPYGGDGIWLASTLVFRMGGIMSRSSKVTAVSKGETISFAIKSALVVDKNHITNVAANGKILCTDHGFILDDKATIDAYKKDYKDGWDLQYDEYWDHVNDK